MACLMSRRNKFRLGALFLFAICSVVYEMIEQKGNQFKLLPKTSEVNTLSEKLNDKYDRLEKYNDSFIDNTHFDQELKYTVIMQSHLSQYINWTNPTRPLTNFAYLIENRELCTSVQHLNVIVVVNSAPNHFERRQAMRDTWTNDTFYPHLGTVKVLFLLGMARHYHIQIAIDKEFQQHNDVLQGDFVDTYYNLTHKGVMCYKWLTERCRNAEIILKVDDDFLVNMFIYFRKLWQIKSLSSANVFCDYRKGLICRRKSSKWYLSKNHLKGKKYYTKYCMGKFVSLTNDIIPSLYVSASQSPFFPFDDVLLYGYVMNNVRGIKYKTLTDKDMESRNYAAILCLKTQKRNCSKFVIGATGRQEMVNTWQLILKYFS